MPTPLKSIAQLKLEGTFRVDRHGKIDETALAHSRPKMPKDLTPEAQKEWKRVVKGLSKRNTLTSVDSSVLELHARMWARYLKVVALAEANPVHEVSWLDKNGNEHFKTVESPASGMCTKLENSLRNSLKELSATPASRDRAKPTAPPVPKGADVAQQAEAAVFSREATAETEPAEEPEIDLNAFDETCGGTL
jgi:P27 family predicted phage terminase small subunit